MLVNVFIMMLYRQSRAEAAAQKISDYQAKEKAKMAVSETSSCYLPKLIHVHDNRSKLL